MSILTILTLVAVFGAVGLLTFAIATLLASPSDSARRRLSTIVQQQTTSLLISKTATLADESDQAAERILNALPNSYGSVKRLRRELALGGFYTTRAAAIFAMSEIICPLILAGLPLLLLTGINRWIAAGLGVLIGYMGPSFLLGRRCKRRQKEIQNGLADALDLLVLCLEAGSSLDQALVKAGDELGVAYPALGDQLHILITEMRAGKTRLDAFRGLAERTRVDDVRALVSMLIQTDRFGTSVAQALRTHAETCRTKRRQRAEERAQKVGVKLVFPLVFCLFPALYVVMLGPAYIRFMKVFGP